MRPVSWHLVPWWSKQFLWAISVWQQQFSGTTLLCTLHELFGCVRMIWCRNFPQHHQNREADGINVGIKHSHPFRALFWRKNRRWQPEGVIDGQVACHFCLAALRKYWDKVLHVCHCGFQSCYGLFSFCFLRTRLWFRTAGNANWRWDTQARRSQTLCVEHVLFAPRFFSTGQPLYCSPRMCGWPVRVGGNTKLMSIATCAFPKVEGPSQWPPFACHLRCPHGATTPFGHKNDTSRMYYIGTNQ